MPITIRPESPSDARTIEAVTVAAFRDAPHTSHTEHLIVNALRDADALTISLVAERERRVVGHVAISPVTISDGSGDWYGLGPVSVVPELQRQGIGAGLVREALQRLRAQDAAGCVVLGEPEYYGRFGFRAEPALILPGVPPEYFQALTFSDSLPKGDVSYHSAFSAATVN